VPVASLATPDEYTFWAPGVWGEVEDRMLETLAPLGAHRSDPFLNQAAKATAQSDKLRRQLAPFAANSGNGFGSPVAYPKVDSSFPRQLSGLAAMLAANLPLRCVALTAPGEYDTHADQPQALADGLDVTWRTCWPFSATSRRAGSPTACSRSSGRSSAGAARRTAATEPPRRGGRGFPDRHPRPGQDGRRVPRPREPRRGRKPEADLGLPPRLLLAARAVAGHGRRGGDPERALVRAAGAGRVTKILGAFVLAVAFTWHPTPARLGVGASEFHLVLSRASVKAGAVEIELLNDGEDPHDLRVRRVGGTHTYSIPLTRPGARRSIEIRPGRASTASGARSRTTARSG
jgi:hypothetical protein